MERSILSLVNQANLEGRLRSNPTPMFFPNFFGIKEVSTLTWKTLVGEQGVPVIADVISFDSSAPIKSREVIRKLSGDIPKISIKYPMNESELNEYIRLQSDIRNDARLRSVLDLAFKDTDRAYNGVRGRIEWMALQLLSRGGFMLNPTNNDGIVTTAFVGCGMPNDNRRVSTADWSNSNTADGLQDIADAVDMAFQKGRNIRYVVMRADDFALLRKQKSTIEALKGWLNQSGKLAPSFKVINNYLADQEFPVEIKLVKPAVRIENAAHVRKTVCPWERKRIALIEDLRVGDIQHGPIASETLASMRQNALMVKKDFVLVSKWSEPEPVKEWTKAEANAMPVINDPEGLFILKADGTSWNDDTEGTDNVPAMLLGETVKPESLTIEE